MQEHISGPIYLRSRICRRIQEIHAKTRFSRNQRKKLTPVRAAIFRVFKQRKYTEIHEKHAFSRNYSISRIFRRIQKYTFLWQNPESAGESRIRNISRKCMNFHEISRICTRFSRIFTQKRPKITQKRPIFDFIFYRNDAYPSEIRPCFCRKYKAEPDWTEFNFSRTNVYKFPEQTGINT